MVKSFLTVGFTLLCLLSSFSTFGQEEEEVAATIPLSDYTSPYPHNIGIAMGLTIGKGIAYKYLPKRIGAQITYAPLITSDRDYHHGGLTLFYKLQQKELSSFYLYQATSYESDKKTDERGNVSSSEYVHIGLGFGLEMNLLTRLRLNLMGGFGSLENFKENGITAEAGLFYAF